MAEKPKQPAIPAVPNDVSPSMRNFMTAIREVLQVQAGQGRGNEIDRAVTFRDLQGSTAGSGLSSAALRAVLTGYAASQVGTETVERPTAPTGVSVSAYIGGVFVSWDNQRYGGHAMTEVFFQRTEVNANNTPKDPPAINTETMLNGTSSSTNYAIAVETGYGYYVWARHVNRLGVVGPLSKPLGDFIFVPHRPSELIAQLQGQVNEDVFTQELLRKIEAITVNTSAIDAARASIDEVRGSVTDARNRAAADLAAASNALNEALSTLRADVNFMNTGTGTRIDSLSQQFSDAQMSLAEQFDLMEAAFQAGDAQAHSDILSLSQVVSDNRSALAQAISSLDASYKAADSTTNATIATLTQTVSDAQSALSQAISRLDADYKAADAGVNAAVVSESSARASADAALSSSINALTSTVTSNHATLDAAIISEQNTRASADAALSSSINALTATVNNNNATLSAVIASEQNARVSADAALSSRTDVVEAYIGGDIGNLFLNPSFTSNTHGFYSAGTVRYAGYPYIPSGCPTANCIELNARDTLGKRINVAAGDVFHVSMACATSDSSAPTVNLGFFAHNSAGDVVGWYVVVGRVASDALGTWKNVSGSFTVPNGVTSIQLWVQLDYFAPFSHWWMLTNVNFTNANATRPVSAAVVSEQNARASADAALSSSINALTSTVNSNHATLDAAVSTEQNARASADAALSSSINALTATVNNNNASLSAVIASEQTTRASADNAIASSVNSLASTVDGHTAAIQTNASAIAAANGTYSAQWSTKTTVADLTGGFGIYNDGSNVRFTVAANRFAIVDPSGNGAQKVPFVVDNGKTVISDAFIRNAYIEQLAAGQITAAKINSLTLNAINITGGTLSLGSGNYMSYQEGGSIGLGKGGPYGGWGYGWNTIIYNNGNICTNNLTASGGSFTGTVNANAGTFNNVTINDNCDVRGTIYADKIVGDVVAIKYFRSVSGTAPRGTWVTLESFNIAGSSKQRLMQVSGSGATMTMASSGTFYIQLLINGAVVNSNPVASGGVDRLYDIPAGGNVNIIFRVYMYSQPYNYSYSGGLGTVTITPVSNGTFI
jgi:hypothetical protein